MTWVKVCGLTRESDVSDAVDAGADALGFVLAKTSPRRISVGQATALMDGVSALRILVTVDARQKEIADMVDLQIGKQTPYSRGEIVSGYRILGSIRDGYTQVMLAIAQRGIVAHLHRGIEGIHVHVENHPGQSGRHAGMIPGPPARPPHGAPAPNWA